MDKKKVNFGEFFDTCVLFFLCRAEVHTVTEVSHTSQRVRERDHTTNTQTRHTTPLCPATSTVLPWTMPHKITLPRDGPDPTRHFITLCTHATIISRATRGGCVSVCSRVLPRATHQTSLHIPRSTDQHSTPRNSIPLLRRLGPLRVGTGRMRPCRSPRTAVRKSSDLRKKRHHDVQTGVGLGWGGEGGWG